MVQFVDFYWQVYIMVKICKWINILLYVILLWNAVKLVDFLVDHLENPKYERLGKTFIYFYIMFKLFSIFIFKQESFRRGSSG